MNRIFFWLTAIFGAALLTGCAVTPGSIVQQPTSTRPAAAAPQVAANGAIFQGSTYRPIFEDRRARLVGDTLTIAINERTSAGKQAANSASKNGSADASVPLLFGAKAATLAKLSAQADSEVTYEDKGAASSSNNFAGTLTVTVAEVLPNGNLVVSGEKQVALDKGAEFIRFSGVVNPSTISGNNVVSSTQVADARVEYRTNSQIDGAQMMSILARFFLSVLPL
jgi:flagellar L-ring protein FlgH